MTNINRIPTYNELVELSNGDLTACVKKALENLQAAKARGEDTTDKEKIYWAFQEERLKRMNLGKKQGINLPPTIPDTGPSFDRSN